MPMALIRANEELQRRVRLIAISVGAWAGIAALFSLQRVYGFAARGVDPVWDRLALEMAITWGGWAILTPVILLAVRRVPLPSDNAWRLVLHLPIGVGVGLLHSLIVATITPLFIWRPSLLPIRDMFAGRLASVIASETLIYFMVAAVLYAWIYATAARDRQNAFLRAKSGLAKAELDAMRLADERDQLSARLNEMRNQDPASASLAVPARDGLIRVPLKSIEWLQAEDNYVRLHTAGRSHLLRTTLSALEQKLAARDFVRIHRSALVSVNKIARLKRVASNRYAVVLSNGAQLRVSRAYRNRVIAALETPLTTH